MPKPFEVDFRYLVEHIDQMVSETFNDLQSQFLILPKGGGFVEYSDFQDAYEVLKKHTSAFMRFSDETVWAAFREDSLSFLVLRTILGMTPPEWADLTRAERGSDVSQKYARDLDRLCRSERGYFARLISDRRGKTRRRVDDGVSCC